MSPQEARSYLKELTFKEKKLMKTTINRNKLLKPYNKLQKKYIKLCDTIDQLKEDIYILKKDIDV